MIQQSNSPARAAVVLISALLLCASWALADEAVSLTGPGEVTLYETAELAIQWHAALASIASARGRLLFDAFDADNDGRFIRVDAIFRRGEGPELIVPAFPMKGGPDGPWLWRVRFAPRATGLWSCALQVAAALDTGPDTPLAVRKGGLWRCDFRTDDKDYQRHFDGGTFELTCADDPRAVGPIVKPVRGEKPNYFWRLGPGGQRQWMFAYSVTRPWVVPDDPKATFPDEWIDRETELFEPMRAHGANLLYMWMAPWELLLLHRKPAELWPVADANGKQLDGQFEEHPIPEDENWASYAYYDQGRAAAMDRIMQQLERYDERLGSPIYAMLAFLPHTVFQMSGHPWSGFESGWSIEDDWGDSKPQKINGFSGFMKGMHAYQFFEASPQIADRTDWRRQLWDWQAAFFRYIVARWGASKSLAAWVLMDELDAVGDELGSQLDQKGWWGHPECSRWHDDVLRFFRGELSYERDGQTIPYGGDPFGHLISSSAMEYDYHTGAEDNGTWIGGQEKVDFATYHSYPVHVSTGRWSRQDDGTMAYLPLDKGLYPYGVYAPSYGFPSYIPADSRIWQHAAQRLRDWASALGTGRPLMITESGYSQRYDPVDSVNVYGAKYPTVFHYEVWSAVVNGHASTPIDWCDGKEFGEMSWRDRPGSFSRELYPVNLYLELQSARAFIGELDLPALKPAWAQEQIVIDLITEGGRRLPRDRGDCWALVSNNAVAGWAFVTSRDENDIRVRIRGLPENAAYAVQFFNTWTGEFIGDAQSVQAEADGRSLTFPLSEAIRTCTRRQTEEVQDDQKDVAFILRAIAEP